MSGHAVPVRLELLHVPGCPNVALFEQRLHQVLGEEPAGIELIHREVRTWEAATAAGMSGSPTLLVDGDDPFAEPGSSPSLSCRLYTDEHGRFDGAPSPTALRRVLADGA